MFLSIKKECNVTLYFAAFSVAILSLISGLTGGWSSPVLPKLTDEAYFDENPFGELISSDAESWIVSLMSLGAVLGTIPFALLSDKIGRKPTLLILAVPLFISSIMLAFSKVIILYYIARFIIGVAKGGIFSVLPMYMAEIAEVSNRGIITSFFSASMMLGMLISYAVGPYIHLTLFNLLGAFFAAAFFLLFLLFCPESPTYLIAIDKPEAAKKALQMIRIKGRGKEIDNELKEIKSEAEKNTQGSFRDFYNNKGLTKALLISVVLIGFQPSSGCDVIQFYSQSIFKETGTSIPSEISSVVIGVVQFTSGLIAPFFVDRIGRKPLLLLSAFVMALAETPLGIYFYLNSETSVDTSSIQWLPIASLILYFIGFNCGFGPLPFTVMGEIFPSHVKTIACGVTATSVWLVSFATTKSFLIISEAISTGGTFWMFAGLSCLAGIFVLVFLPETKGKTFLQIQKGFKM